MATEDEYEIICCVCGYHIYRQVWGASIGELFVNESKLMIRIDIQLQLVEL